MWYRSENYKLAQYDDDAAANALSFQKYLYNLKTKGYSEFIETLTDLESEDEE